MVQPIKQNYYGNFTVHLFVIQLYTDLKDIGYRTKKQINIILSTTNLQLLYYTAQ